MEPRIFIGLLQVRFINLIYMHFVHKSLHTPYCIPASTAGNQSQEALQRALEHIHPSRLT